MLIGQFCIANIHLLFAYRLVKCTRWSELTETMRFMADLSDALGSPSEFRLLNGSDPIIVGLEGSNDGGESMSLLKEVLEESPGGPTPLCGHIDAVVKAIESVSDLLRTNGQKITVMIATDGESSDGNVADALRPLENVRAYKVLLNF